MLELILILLQLNSFYFFLLFEAVKDEKGR